MTDFHIRPLVATDRDQWQSLWDGYCHFYETVLTARVTESTWQRLLTPDYPVHGRIAVRGERLVGFAHHVLHPSTWKEAESCYLEDLFVAPEERGAGIGRAMIDDLLALCKAKGWSRLYWHTNQSNARARALYDSYVPVDPFVRYRIALDPPLTE
jgi:GNAT superfamily N-acetyltransferase